MTRLTLLLATACACAIAGCQSPPFADRNAYFRAQQLEHQNQIAQQSLVMLSARNAELEGDVTALRTEMKTLSQRAQIANKRYLNLASERGTLKERYIQLLTHSEPAALSAQTAERFRKLAKQFPAFGFDPETGIGKFESDLLFGAGSARIRDGAMPILKQLAGILSTADTSSLQLMIVGHTDDQPVARKPPGEQHASNWHLSTNRANAVATALASYGITNSRMGVAGYAGERPVVENDTERNRSRNRRVEIFILAPEAKVVGREPEA